MPQVVEKYMGPQLQAAMGMSLAEFRKKGNDIGLYLQPLTDVHLHSDLMFEMSPTGNIQQVYIFSAIAIFMLLIACINFMNLSTAGAAKRAREVGIRKVVGAQRGFLIMQFLGESILLSLIAFAIALFLVQISLSSFNQLVGKELFINYADPVFWLLSISFLLFTGLLAGSYPAFYLSGFKPSKVLKGSLLKVNALIAPRKILVVTQFTFAIILMIATIIVVRQIQYGLNRQSGYDRENLIYVFTQGKVDQHYQSIKNV